MNFETRYELPREPLRKEGVGPERELDILSPGEAIAFSALVKELRYPNTSSEPAAPVSFGVKTSIKIEKGNIQRDLVERLESLDRIVIDDEPRT